MNKHFIKHVAKKLGLKKVPLALIKKPKSLLKDLKFELDTKYFANRASGELFKRSPPHLSNAQNRVVEELHSRGISVIGVDELFGPNFELWNALNALAMDFEKSDTVKHGIQEYGKNYHSADWKEYIIRLYPGKPTLNLTNAFVQFGIQRQMLDTVNAYLGLWSKLKGVNMWYTIPLPQTRKRVASQNWHRDPEDRKLIKAFLYFHDVDDGAGPLEYIPDSRSGRRLSALWRETTGSGGYGYPSQEKIESAVGASDVFVAKCPRASIVFCDTSGLHRGGFATQRARLLAQWIYLTPASQYGPWFELKKGTDLTSLDSVVQYALSDVL